jgi:hypothetical protein
MELLAIMNLLLMILLLLGERRITKKVKEMEDRNLALSKLLIEQQNDNKEITVFSLRCIIKEAIDKEDFETAHKCKELIEKYETDSSIPGRG